MAKHLLVASYSYLNASEQRAGSSWRVASAMFLFSVDLL